jgi:5-methylcytosine-specific restriction endonuclease McrA
MDSGKYHILHIRRNEVHEIYTNEPHDQSYAFYILYKNDLIKNDKKRKKKLSWGRMEYNLIYLKIMAEINGQLTCAYCQKKVFIIKPHAPKTKKILYSMATADHILPISRGGHPFSFKNLCVACNPCNQSKKNQTNEEWEEKKFNSLPKKERLTYKINING